LLKGRDYGFAAPGLSRSAALGENGTMKFDVVIVGGGLAGLALAVALRDSRLSIALLESRVPVRAAGWDARIYAISPANRRFLSRIGAWEHLDPGRMVPVQTMSVAGDAGGLVGFSAYDSGVDELAFIVESSLIQCELWESAKRQANLSLICPGKPAALTLGDETATVSLGDGRILSAALVVAADGADSWTRAAAGINVEFTSYRQSGVVANFETGLPHRATAFQWFRDDGILAWLPLPGNRISMVWSTPTAHAEELLTMPPEAFSARVAAAGGDRLGPLRLMAPPAAFPLRLMRAPRTTRARLALIGDAAHAIHPLSGHGINLGFQDAEVLAATLRDRGPQLDCGDPLLLRRYERARIGDVLALQTLTDGLQRLFAYNRHPLGILRNLGMNLVDGFPVLKDGLVRFALNS
jgi:ubiquinone biosynthesis UbiH/UbiF/VisC/COQ6 family hydroxylase